MIYFRNQLLLLLMLSVGTMANAQDTLGLVIQLDSSFLSTLTLFSSGPPVQTGHDYLIWHAPDHEDSTYIKQNEVLIGAQPDEENFSRYYNLARALWETGDLERSETLFLNIVNSNEACYTNTYYHNSDIPGDTVVNTYGYGSFTSNYKNKACRFLARIYVETKSYEKALHYILLADKTYPVTQNCGTGHQWYRNELHGIYGLAYQGLNLHDSIINLFLPEYHQHGNILINAIQNKYSQTEINAYLETAIQSVEFTPDTYQSLTISTHNYSKDNEYETEEWYTSGKATVSLFNQKIDLLSPRLKGGETMTKAMFIQSFKDSYFYRHLYDEQN